MLYVSDDGRSAPLLCRASAMLEQAFRRTLNNPTLAETLAKQGEIFAPQSGPDVAAIVDKVLAISPDTLAELKHLITE